MAANYGVNVTISSEAAKPISVQSNTPIGIVGIDESLESGLYFYMSIDEALEAVQASKNSTVKRALKHIESAGVKTQIILSVVHPKTPVSDFKTLEEAKYEADIKKAINALKEAKSLTGYAPDLIIAPYFSHLSSIKSEMESIATRLKATGLVDLDNKLKPNEAIAKMGDFGTRRLVAIYPYVKYFDEDLGEKDESGNFKGEVANAPASSFIAGLIAKTDGESEFGYSDSFSNRVIMGIEGTSVPIDFELGETCTADELRVNNITTIIREQGFRAWGGETSDMDTIWKDLARVRIFDRISKAAQKGVLFAIDKKASELYYAKSSVEELLRGLVGAKVLLGYELSWSPKNTLANITAGKFYLDVRMQNNPIVKQLTLDFIYVDKYSDSLMDSLK